MNNSSLIDWRLETTMVDSVLSNEGQIVDQTRELLEEELV